jgi:hypothetical protein
MCLACVMLWSSSQMGHTILPTISIW